MAAPLGDELAAQWINDGTAARLLTARRVEMDLCHTVAGPGIRWRTIPVSYHGSVELNSHQEQGQNQDHEQNSWTGEFFLQELCSPRGSRSPQPRHLS